MRIAPPLALLASLALAAGPTRPSGSRSLATPAGLPEAFTVIVHPAVPAVDVSLAQLREIFLGRQRTWSDGTPVVLIVQSAATRSRAVLLRVIYRMDEGAFRRYSIAWTFGESAWSVAPRGVGAGPTLVSSDALARRLTATIAGAIAVVPAGEVDGGVKVLRVDGRLPGDAGYALTGAALSGAP
jgi:hypothetical protein